MNKKAVILTCLILAVISLLGFKALTNLSSDNPILTEPQEDTNSLLVSVETIPADKIEVVHFHGTRQCWSCITVGEFALETIKNMFPEEYQSGRIVFKDINSDLPENKAIVDKYQARGSSLFVNAVSNNKDSIEEDTTVWRLVTNQERFTDYFENKLKALLGE